MSTLPLVGNASESVSVTETDGAAHAVVSLAGRCSTTYPSVSGEHAEETSPTPTTFSTSSAPDVTGSLMGDDGTADQ